MEQKLRFGLVLGQLALLKQILGRLQVTFEGSFSMFLWAKKIKKYYSVRTKKLHKMKVKKNKIILKKVILNFEYAKKHFQLCLSPLQCTARLMYNDFA